MNKPSPHKLLTLTEKAVNHINGLISESDKPIDGLHISVRNTGCAGMAYEVNYAKEEPKNSVKVEDKGITLYIDNFASVFLAGSQIDYKTELLSSGFTFDNPNITGECGCGESFTVDESLAQTAPSS